MTLKAVAFDLWETLITEPPEVPHSWSRRRLEKIGRILSERGSRVSRERLETAYREVWDRCQDEYWSSDKDVSCRTQVDHLIEALELGPFDDPTTAAIEEAYAMAAVEEPPMLVDGAREVLTSLKSSGYLLGLISNTGRTPGYALRIILERLGVASLLDAMVFSNEHGELKPQRSIFEALRRALDVGFDQMLFIGDNLYVDVYGAELCGITAVHFAPPRRGTAVAPPVNHHFDIKPKATISDLRQLLPLVASHAAPLPR